MPTQPVLPGHPPVGGSNTVPTNPLLGTDETSAGVTGQSNVGPGVLGQSLGSSSPILSDWKLPSDGVLGNGYNGVHGVSAVDNSGASGVLGEHSGSGCGVSGTSASGTGVYAVSKSSDGVYGVNGKGSGTTPQFSCGVRGESDNGYGVYAASMTNDGVYGVNGKGSGTTPQFSCGIRGESDKGCGLYAASKTSDGVYGVNGKGSGTTPQFGCGVRGESDNGYGVYGSSKTSNAGQFDGNVAVTGTVTAKDVLLSGMDCAEDFAVANAASLEPGTVVVFDGEDTISPCMNGYNKRVAGVISGAGKYQPAVVLGRNCVSGGGKAPVALLGRVYCKVDADYSAIAIGDLLTTSSTPGHAMKASDSVKGIGSVIGKALRPMESGQGLLPILVALQ